MPNPPEPASSDAVARGHGRGLRFVDLGLAAGLAVAAHVGLSCLLRGYALSFLALACAWLVGAALAVPLFGLLAGLARHSRRVSAAVCAGLGLIGGIVLAQRLGAFAKLGGPHGKLAVAVLVAAPLACAALGLVLAATLVLVTTPPRARQRWTIVVATLVGLLLASGFITIDHNLVLLLAYRPVGTALTSAACILLLLPALAIVRTARARVGRGGWLAVAYLTLATAALPFAALVGPRSYNPALLNPDVERYVGLLRWATDWDRDGHSSLFGGADCASFDASVHPGARELPGNGKDDNCQHGDAPVRLDAPLPILSASPAVSLSVVLVTFDALRPDHMSAYGYPRDTTPRLARFARHARRFDRAYANGAWTELSLPSLFGSALPRDIQWKLHGATDRGRILEVPYERWLRPRERVWTLLPIATAWPVPPLPRLLEQRGMRTLAVVPQAIAETVKLGVGKHFAVVQAAGPHDGAIADQAIRLLTEHQAEAHFLWVHFYGAHWPYETTATAPPWGSRGQDAYDGAIFAADREAGRVLDHVLGRGGPPTALIVTADHGESFSGDTGAHGLDLRESGLRVPLLVRGPAFEPGESDVVVSLVDVMPTIMLWTGIPVPEQLAGIPLSRAAHGRTIISDLWRYDMSGKPYLNSSVAIREDQRLEKNLIAGTQVHSRLGAAIDTLAPGTDAATAASLEQSLGQYLERAIGGP